MSERIKKEDIFEPGLFTEGLAGFEKFVQLIKETKEGIDHLTLSERNLLNVMKFDKSVEIDKLNKSIQNSNTLLDQGKKLASEQSKAEVALLKVQQEKEKLAQQQLKTEKAKAAAQAASTKETVKASKEQAKLNSEYQQAAQSLTKLEKRLLDNNIAGRKTSATARLLAEEHEKMRSKIDGAEQAAGRFQRNVGNYSQQLRQLQREMQGLEPGSKAFNDLAVKAGRLRDAIGDAKDATKAFATESKLTTGKTLFTQIGRDIADLNFADAADKAKQFASVIKSMTFAEAIGGIKSLGSAILDVGKSLLLNPFTLIVAGIASVAYVLYDFGKAMYNAQFNTKTFNEALVDQSKELKKYAERVKETQISIKETLGIYTAFQAEQKRKEIKDSNEILDIRKKHIETQFALAEELELDISKMKNNRFNENYTGDFKELLRRKKFNAEISTLESIRDRDIAAAQSTQRLENLQAEISDNVKRGDKAKEDQKKLNTDLQKINDDAAKEKERKQKERDDKIISEMEIKEEKKLKAKQIIDEYNSKQLQSDSEEVWWNKEEGITLEQHNQDVANIEETKNKREASDKAAEEKRKQQRKEELNSTLEFIDKISKIENSAKERQLDNDLAMRQRNIMQQQDLATRGLNNTLAFEKAAAAKDELAKQQLAIKQEKQAKALAFLKLLAGYADKDADTALSKALVEMAIASAISGSFKDGVEGLDGAGTETSDSILARLSKNESVITAKGTKADPGLPTAMNKGKVSEYFEQEYLPKYMTETGFNTGSLAQNMTNSMLLHQVTTLNKEITEIKQVLKDRPTNSVNLNNLGEVVDTKIVNGLKKQTIHKRNSPLNYI